MNPENEPNAAAARERVRVEDSQTAPAARMQSKIAGFCAMDSIQCHLNPENEPNAATERVAKGNLALIEMVLAPIGG